MSGLFSRPKIPTAAQPSTPPGLTDPQTREAAQEQAPTYGPGSTILTSGMGVSTPPALAKKNLTGG